MNKRTAFSPILMELIVVILFFGLTMSVVLRLAAAANAISLDSAHRADALMAMQTAAERLKADPAGGTFGANGVRSETFSTTRGVCIQAEVTGREAPAGTMYEIVIRATGDGMEPMVLEAARYVSGGEVAG